AARRRFGNVTLAKEESRDMWLYRWLEIFLQDVRFGLRMLGKNTGFTTVAVLTLALGIGANTAMFSVIHGVVLAPLPYFQPDRLVMVWESNPRFPRVWVSYPNFLDWQRTARSFRPMAAFMERGVNLTGPGTPEHLNGKEVSSGFFSTLGLELVLGREFSPEEDRAGGTPVVIVSNRLWRNRFYGNPEVLGKSVTLDGVDYTIVGVTPPGFRIEEDADVYTPLGRSDPVTLNNRASHDGIFSVARLAPGVTVSQGQAEMNTIQSSLDRLYPDANRDLGIYVEPLKQVVVGDVGGTLLLLLGAVGLVLLIACANVANLLLARSAARGRELAVRSALGANRARLVRQLLTESVLLSLAGAGLGLLIAILGVKPVLAAVPEILPRSEDIGVNAPVLLLTLGVSITVGILFGLAPALKSWNVDLQASLKEGGRGATSAHHSVQSGLVIVQMSLTLVLLVGAGLLFQTIRHLWSVDAGFETQHAITFKVGVSPSLTKTPSSTRVAYQQLIERIRRIPGVQAADFTSVVPLSGQGGTMPFWIGSQKPASLQRAPRLAMFLAGPDYLRTMGIPLLRGRFFTQEDNTKAPCVMVIDSVFAHMYFPDSDPLDQTLSAGFSSIGPCRIVGVAGHVKQWALDDSGKYIQNQAYLPLYQVPDQWVPIGYANSTVVVRTLLDTATLMPAIKAAVYSAGSDQPVFDVQTMQEIVSESMSSQRFPMILLGVFAALALLLASVGIYGVISYSVAQRVNEIGIRMALGAEKRNIFRLVIGQGLRLVLVGLAIGAVAALILTRLLSSFSVLLYGVHARDPWTLIGVSLVLVTAALLACYVPAWRAMRVDPMTALRHE
ncbi:MAG TPA: ABC transporter permease, partial [Bryobacteraceae bacterium]|nr:ABC transporter permease [Bryobacteraceae bacterium]